MINFFNHQIVDISKYHKKYIHIHNITLLTLKYVINVKILLTNFFQVTTQPGLIWV